MSDAVYTQSTKYSGTYLVTIFFRSTVCTSCHFRTGMDHLDKPFSLPVFSECVMRCHLCLFRSPVPPALFLPSARSGYGIRYGSSSLRWNWSSRRTYRIPSSYILPVAFNSTTRSISRSCSASGNSASFSSYAFTARSFNVCLSSFCLMSLTSSASGIFSIGISP